MPGIPRRIETRARIARDYRSRRLLMEQLEERCLMDGGMAQLADDRFEVRTNQPARVLDVLINDVFGSDYSGERRITSVSYGSQGGRAELAADRRAVTYAPPPDFSGEESFVYLVDGVAAARVAITIVSPVKEDQYEIIQATGPIDLDVLANDPFPPDYTGRRIIRFVSETTQGGAVQIIDAGQRIRYTPAPENTVYDRSDAFSYFVDDGLEAKVTVTLRAPVHGDSYQLEQNSRDNLLLVTANDQAYFYEGNHYEDVVDHITAVSSPEHGRVAITADGQGLHYTPAPDFLGSDHFQYVVDGRYEADVSVYVTRPVRDDYVYAVQDGGAVRLNVLSNDFYSDAYRGKGVITAVTQSEQGAIIEISDAGQAIRYTPPQGFTGIDSFQYTVDQTLIARVAVEVRPRARNDYFEFCVQPATERSLRLDVLANDAFGADYAGAGLISNITTISGEGMVAIAEGGRQIVATNLASAPSYQSLQYTVDDRYTANATYSMRSYLRSDAFSADQNSSSAVLDVLHNDDFETGCWQSFDGYVRYTGPRIITAVTSSSHGGTVRISTDGKAVEYTPPIDFVGADTLSYTVDGNQRETATVQVIRRVRDDRFHVDPGSSGNRLPVLVNDGFGTDYAGSRRITQVTATGAFGAVGIGDDGKSIIYAPPADFTGTDSFTYTVDGRLKARVDVVVQSSAAATLPHFESDDDLEQFLIDRAVEQYADLFGKPVSPCFTSSKTSFYSGCVYALYDLDGGAGAAPTPPNHSDTNVQVAGVDEGDIVENDGQFLYVLTGNELVIVRAWPASELAVVSRIDVHGTPIGMFLHGDRVSIISSRFEQQPMPYPSGLPIIIEDSHGGSFGPVSRPTISRATVRVTAIDVADHAAPHVLTTADFEGRYVDSRAIGDQVYLVLSNFLDLPYPEQKCEDAATDDGGSSNGAMPNVRHCQYETRDEYVARIQANRAAFFDQVLANVTVARSGDPEPTTTLVNSAETIVRPIGESAQQLVSLVSLEIAAAVPHIADAEGVLTSNAATIYGSLENVYVFDQGWSSDGEASTSILQFAWDDSPHAGADGGVQLVATGEVPGRLLNQFSADEHGGVLRVATTLNGQSHWTAGFNWNAWSAGYGRSHNDLYTLREDHGVLELVGGLQDLAPGETIRSVRFLGDRAFVTTFRTIDPLFALDLADAAAPRVVGSLNVPGFSSYMQPIDENHLLTVGLNTPNGWAGAPQVSLFDVRDMTHPSLIDNYTFERFSITEAASDHHAFGYFAEHGVLAIPTGRSYWIREDTDGDGFRETRRWVNESELLVFAIDVTPLTSSDDAILLLGQVEQNSRVRRSAFIGDVLYSVATGSIKAVSIADPSNVIAEANIGSVDPAGDATTVIRLGDSFGGDGGTIPDPNPPNLDPDPPGGGTIEPTPEPPDSGSSDPDPFASLSNATVTIIADPTAPGDSALVIIGTDRIDRIRIRTVQGGRQISVRLNRDRHGPFDAATIDRILVDGRAGDDLIRMSRSVHVPVVISDQLGRSGQSAVRSVTEDRSVQPMQGGPILANAGSRSVHLVAFRGGDVGSDGSIDQSDSVQEVQQHLRRRSSTLKARH